MKDGDLLLEFADRSIPDLVPTSCETSAFCS